MKRKLMIFAILAIAMAAFVISGAAQRPQNYQDPSPQDQSRQDQSRPGAPGGGMMGGGMMMGMSMGMMIGQMSAHHDEITETMAKVMQSMNAITQNERNEKALRAKLAEHRALLDQLQTQLQEEGGTMRNMTQMMGGPAAVSPSGPAPSK